MVLAPPLPLTSCVTLGNRIPSQVPGFYWFDEVSLSSNSPQERGRTPQGVWCVTLHGGSCPQAWPSPHSLQQYGLSCFDNCWPFPLTPLELEFLAPGFEWEEGGRDISSDFLSTSLWVRPRERKGRFESLSHPQSLPGTESLRDMAFPLGADGGICPAPCRPRRRACRLLTQDCIHPTTPFWFPTAPPAKRSPRIPVSANPKMSHFSSRF